MFSEFQRSYSYQIMIMSVDISFYSYNLSGNNSHFSINLLSRWDWIDVEIIASIVKEVFDFNSFSRLFREYANRQAHTIIVMNEVHLSIDNIRSYMITIKIKLFSAFPSLTKFLSTWIVYCIIRYAWNPEYISDFFHW